MAVVFVLLLLVLLLAGVLVVSALDSLLELEEESEDEEDSLEVELVVSLFFGELTPLDDLRESVMYQPLPLKTMPTGWMTLRRLPPHCSQVVSGASEKLCRFSRTSLQLVQV